MGLTASGQAVFFDTVHPGIVALPDVAVRAAGNEISASRPGPPIAWPRRGPR